MRILKGPTLNDLSVGNAGRVSVVCDSAEDLWHLYNIIQRGDFIKIVTFRKVANENSTSKSSVKKKIDITIKLEEMDFDQTANEIRIKGKNVSENEYINVGQYQSATIIRGTKHSIFKKVWDEIALEKLRIATDATLSSDLCAVVMEEGLAHLFLISSHITSHKGMVELSMPKKRKGPSNHDKVLDKFFHNVLDLINKNVNFDLIKCIIIGSPGFVKDSFGNYITDQTANNNKLYENIKKNLNKFIYAHCSSGEKQALQELLSKPEILSQIKDTKALDDIKAMDKFNQTLGLEMDKVIFGLKSIKIAVEKGAIDLLLVTDDYLRKISPTLRKEITKLMTEVTKSGGNVQKMSSQHITGEKINAFGGITATIKYLIPELMEFEEEIVDVEDIVEEKIDGDLNIDHEDKMILQNMHIDLEEYIDEIKDTVDELGLGEDEEEEEHDELGDNHPKSISHNKGKLTKSAIKERDQHIKKEKNRKKSSMDEERD